MPETQPAGPAERGTQRPLPWALWSLSLAVCPAAIWAVGIFCLYTGPPGPRPWGTRLVDGLLWAHLAVSVVASVAASVMARGVYRWLAWSAIVVVGLFAAFSALGARMATTGIYL